MRQLNSPKLAMHMRLERGTISSNVSEEFSISMIFNFSAPEPAKKK
jgi:hypothetical protein